MVNICTADPHSLLYFGYQHASTFLEFKPAMDTLFDYAENSVIEINE